MFRRSRIPRDLILEDCDHSQGHTHRFWPIVVLTILMGGCLLFLLLMAYEQAYAEPHLETEQGDTLTLDNVEAGQLLFKTDTGGRYKPALILESRAHFSISGMISHVSLQQSFRNDSTDWVEGIYVFPLPEDAAVNKMRMKIGERIIEGKIHEKKQAKKIYQAAKQAGKKASLVEQERPNMFTNSVANIGPGETVVVEIEYLQTIAYDRGHFSLRFPMTITPRYIPGQPLPVDSVEEQPLVVDAGMGWAVNTDQVPDASRITPHLNPQMATSQQKINPITITAELDAGLPLNSVDSAYHDIVMSRDENRYGIKLVGGSVSMEQDFVLTWQPVTGSEPQAAIFNEDVDGKHYSLVMVLPPQQTNTAQLLPREMIFIIDTSGSMSGVSIEQAKQSVLMALDRLSPQDRFNIIEFNSYTDVKFSQSVYATADNLNQARKIVSSLKANGGTEMYSALEAAFKGSVDENFLRQIIFITDGAVGNEEALFELIDKKLDKNRLFTVGIGSAPNSFFMRKAAQFGRGTFTYIGSVNEVREKMSALFNKLESPVASNLQVDWPAGYQVEAYPQPLPDLYRGEPVLLSARHSGEVLQGDIEISGKTAAQHWQKTLTVKQSNNHKGVSTLWARNKIASLLDEKVTGRDEKLVRDDVLAVALTHQLVSPYTSFVAVEKTPSRPLNEKLDSKAVVNARPKGQSPQTYAYPQTATRATRSLVFGLMLLLMAWIFRASLREEEKYGLVT